MNSEKRNGMIIGSIIGILSLIAVFSVAYSNVHTNESTVKIVHYALPDMDLHKLSYDAELVVLAHVLLVNQGPTVGEPDAPIPTINNLFAVHRVVKGTYTDPTIEVVTEGDLSGNTFVEDSVLFNRGDLFVLFLYKEPIYGDKWAIMGMKQGTFSVIQELVSGKDVDRVQYDAFASNVRDLASRPLPSVGASQTSDSDLEAPPDEALLLSQPAQDPDTLKKQNIEKILKEQQQQQAELDQKSQQEETDTQSEDKSSEPRQPDSEVTTREETNSTDK